MMQTGEAKVSDRGQIALPAQARHRWGFERGGIDGWINLGDAVLLVPGGVSQLCSEVLGGADWDGARTGLRDPDLANE